MNITQQDTIAAIATPPGNGGVGIIRLSGGRAKAIAELLVKKELQARYAHYASFYDFEGGIIDFGLVIYFPNPASFTGEDVVEIQGHGGAVILDMLLRHVLSLGCRLANPGEFSERAFLNGKLDLAQAEAIADLIESSTEQSARSAQKSMQGIFSEKINNGDIVKGIILKNTNNYELNVNKKIIKAKLLAAIAYGDKKTRTFPIKFKAKVNGDFIFDGQEVKVKLSKSAKITALVVPRDAVIKRFGSNMIFINKDNAALMLPVQIIAYIGKNIAVKAKGLQKGAEVIIKGNERVFPKQALQIINKK